MEKTFQTKTNVNKTKDRKSKKIETFARDFKIYSKMVKQNPNKNEQTKEKSDCKNYIIYHCILKSKSSKLNRILYKNNNLNLI